MAQPGREQHWRDFAQTERIGDVRARTGLPAHHLNAFAIEVSTHPCKVIGANPHVQRHHDTSHGTHSHFRQHPRPTRNRDDLQGRLGPAKVRHFGREEVANEDRRFRACAVRETFGRLEVELRQWQRGGIRVDTFESSVPRKMSWSEVWRRRLGRHFLVRPAPAERMQDVVGQVCGIHAQVTASAELSLGLRLDGITREDVAAALWRDRTLVKTYGLRGTLHLFPVQEFGLWLAALRAKVPPRGPNANETAAIPAHQLSDLVQAICAALIGRELTRDELANELEHRFGGWVNESAFPAFGGTFPRWQLALHRAALDGLVVAGPLHGNRVSYVRTEDWLGPLSPVDGDVALRDVCRRFLDTYGPATHAEFARWFYTRPSAARELMASLDLEEVDVEGWRGWLPRTDGDPLTDNTPSVHLLPQFDCYVVGNFPRDRLIPSTAPSALQRGTAAPFSVVLIDGVVGGLWERHRRGAVLDIRVHAFDGLNSRQREQAAVQAERIAAVQHLRASLSFGHVEPRGHL